MLLGFLCNEDGKGWEELQKSSAVFGNVLRWDFQYLSSLVYLKCICIERQCLVKLIGGPQELCRMECCEAQRKLTTLAETHLLLLDTGTAPMLAADSADFHTRKGGS